MTLKQRLKTLYPERSLTTGKRLSDNPDKMANWLLKQNLFCSDIGLEPTPFERTFDTTITDLMSEGR